MEEVQTKEEECYFCWKVFTDDVERQHCSRKHIQNCLKLLNLEFKNVNLGSSPPVACTLCCESSENLSRIIDELTILQKKVTLAVNSFAENIMALRQAAAGEEEEGNLNRQSPTMVQQKFEKLIGGWGIETVKEENSMGDHFLLSAADDNVCQEGDLEIFDDDVGNYGLNNYGVGNSSDGTFITDFLNVEMEGDNEEIQYYGHQMPSITNYYTQQQREEPVEPIIPIVPPVSNGKRSLRIVLDRIPFTINSKGQHKVRKRIIQSCLLKSNRMQRKKEEKQAKKLARLLARLKRPGPASKKGKKRGKRTASSVQSPSTSKQPARTKIPEPPTWPIYLRDPSTIMEEISFSTDEITKKGFTCPHPGCLKVYTTQKSLREHSYSHGGMRPFPCDWPGCQISFARRDKLTRHRRIHTGEKPFQCSLCPMSYGRSDGLTKHMKTHQQFSMGNVSYF